MGVHRPPRPIMRGPRTHAMTIYRGKVDLSSLDATRNPERTLGPKAGRLNGGLCSPREARGWGGVSWTSETHPEGS